MKREALVPIDGELPAMIAEQQQRIRQRWPAGTPVLFPRPQANIDGTQPAQQLYLPAGAPPLAGTTATSATSTASPSTLPRTSGATRWERP